MIGEYLLLTICQLDSYDVLLNINLGLCKDGWHIINSLEIHSLLTWRRVYGSHIKRVDLND